MWISEYNVLFSSENLNASTTLFKHDSCKKPCERHFIGIATIKKMFEELHELYRNDNNNSTNNCSNTTTRPNNNDTTCNNNYNSDMNNDNDNRNANKIDTGNCETTSRKPSR